MDELVLVNSDMADFISIAKDITTGLAALIGAGVAIVGLRAWQHQLKGKTEYELARRLLRAVYRVRDEIHNVRNPAIMPGEFAVAIEEAGIESDDPSKDLFTGEVSDAVKRIEDFVRPHLKL